MSRTATAVKLAAGVAAGAAGFAIASRFIAGRDEYRQVERIYPPIDVLKPFADEIWIVDSGPIRAAGMELPVRMTVVRLSSGDLFLHSPTRFTAELGHSLDALGTVRHLVAPTFAHWTYLGEWQRAYPDAVTWGAPGLRDRAPVRRAGVRIDVDLSDAAPPVWSEDLQQGVIRGGGGFREVYFFDRRSRTLLLADLIENLEACKMPLLTGLLMRAAGATRAKTAHHVRAVLALGGSEAAASLRAMIALAPEHVIFSHGRFFADGGAERLRRAFAWLRAE